MIALIMRQLISERSGTWSKLLVSAGQHVFHLTLLSHWSASVHDQCNTVNYKKHSDDQIYISKIHLVFTKLPGSQLPKPLEFPEHREQWEYLLLWVPEIASEPER